MSVNAINTAGAYAAYQPKKTESKAKNAETKAEVKEQAKSAEKQAENGVVYEKAKQDRLDKKAPYTINKMSAEDRQAIVSQLKADQEARQGQMLSLVQKMFTGQASTAANADDMWKLLAKGDFTVDAETKAQAQKDIAEDGYWGVDKTSERLFDFASALAGDDVDKMKKMQEAMEKGFKQATKAWGRELPEISKKTLEAANKRFEDYYASKSSTADIQ